MTPSSLAKTPTSPPPRRPRRSAPAATATATSAAAAPATGAPAARQQPHCARILRSRVRGRRPPACLETLLLSVLGLLLVSSSLLTPTAHLNVLPSALWPGGGGSSSSGIGIADSVAVFRVGGWAAAAPAPAPAPAPGLVDDCLNCLGLTKNPDWYGSNKDKIKVNGQKFTKDPSQGEKIGNSAGSVTFTTDNKVVKQLKDNWQFTEDGIEATKKAGQYVTHKGQTMVQEKVDGTTLAEWVLQQKAAGRTTGLGIKQTLNDAISQQNALGYKHGDVHMKNIMVDANGQFKTLIDWDAASKLDKNKPLTEDSWASTKVESQCRSAGVTFERRSGTARPAAGSTACKINSAKKVSQNMNAFFANKQVNADGTLDIKATLAAAKANKKTAGAIGSVTKETIAAARGKGGAKAAAGAGAKPGKGEARGAGGDGSGKKAAGKRGGKGAAGKASRAGGGRKSVAAGKAGKGGGKGGGKGSGKRNSGAGGASAKAKARGAGKKPAAAGGKAGKKNVRAAKSKGKAAGARTKPAAKATGPKKNKKAVPAVSNKKPKTTAGPGKKTKKVEPVQPKAVAGGKAKTKK
ncbi:hypothetical protein DFJ73DRAFT_965757 [Zopfochytrium polystomum]|nr:hypothetical protein DFJ73DRAFT_965757 [Zopfochytrium polystomum]